MKKLITGLFISGTILITSSYAYTTNQIQQITQQIGEKIETIINKKTPDTYKRLELYLLVQDKLNTYTS